MAKQQNKLAEKSFFANFKNFCLNFGIAIVWLVKSLMRIGWQKIQSKRDKSKD